LTKYHLIFILFKENYFFGVLMENLKQIRWKQRFSNFENAYSQLKKAITAYEQLSELEKEGLIQRFEYTFELAWKTMKDYLESQGVVADFPRDVIKKSFQYQIIQKGETWLEMLNERNMMAHTYNENNFTRALNHIKNYYYNEISHLYTYLKQKK